MVSLDSQLDTTKCGVGVASYERYRLKEELGAICLEMTVADCGLREKWEREKNWKKEEMNEEK